MKERAKAVIRGKVNRHALALGYIAAVVTAILVLQVVQWVR